MFKLTPGFTARTQYLVNVYAKLNSAGRKDQFSRGRYNDPRQNPYSPVSEQGPLLGQEPSQDELEALQAAGLVKLSKAGAVTCTALGKQSTTGGLGWFE